ncbi:MAG: putative signal peptide protein, partial [Bacteroidota bacterium]
MNNCIRALAFALLLQSYSLSAQIINGSDTLYGNEWIRFDQSYFKIPVANDGIYRIGYQTLAEAGLPLADIPGSLFQLFHNGQEVPLYLSTDGLLGPGDYLEFFGRRNTSELDRHLFKDPEAEMMNPLYSLVTDTAAYFLTWGEGPSLRYIEQANDLSNLPPKEPYHLAKKVFNYFSAHSKRVNIAGIAASEYGISEGYSNSFANSQTLTLSVPNPFPGGPDGTIYIRYGTNGGNHQQVISLNGQALLTEEFSDYTVREITLPAANALLSAPLSLGFQGLASASDRQRIANIILAYPAYFKADNQSTFQFQLPPADYLRYIEIENFEVSGGLPVLYNLSGHTVQTASVANGLVRLSIPPGANPDSFLLVNNQSGVKQVGSLLPVQLTDFADLNAQYLIISNARLFDDGNGVNQVQEYASYRASPAGGGFSTAVVDIQQLYDQFAWGLNRHPLSIRNFTNFVKKNWPDIQYLLIIGKGREYPGIRTASQLSDPLNESFYVPTYGSPGSDNLLTSQLGQSTPMLPIGRIAASAPADIAVYLKKVKDFEADAGSLAIADRQWRKDVLHLGGGGSSTEQSVIKNYLLNLETLIEQNQFGADVSSFYKTSTDPIQVSISDQIFDVINKGVSIITFFGHSAVSTFDFNIDNPNNYDNFAKYPLIISLGCYSGNIHTNGLGISERFVFQPDKGALGMIATAGQGYISSLYAVTNRYYKNLGDSLYGQSIGTILFKTLRHFDIDNSIQPELLEQFYLHGDPAMKLGLAPGPDYLPDPGSVKISPAHVNTGLDSFSLHFSVLNLGKNLSDSISVKIEQILPGGGQGTVLSLPVKTPAYAADLAIKLPVGGKEAVGRNWLNITVDPENKIEEYPPSSGELNNALSNLNGQVGYPVFISDNGAVPVYPADFAIVASPDITLRAATTNPLAPSAKYVFEIDTSARFDSPSRQTAILQQPGGILEWKPALNLPPGSTCYWRVSPDSLSEENGFAWENRSFTWLPGDREGWGQFHYYQFLANRFDGMELNPQTRQLNFAKDYLNLRIRNKLYNFSDQPNGFVNGVRWSDFFRWELQGSLTFVVFDTLGKIWVNPKPGEYGSVNNTAARIAAFPFPADNQQQRAKIIDFIENVIPDKHWVVVYPARRTANNNLNVSDWAADSLQLNGKNIFNTLEVQGAQHIRSLEGQMVPYFLAFRKNHGLIKEELGSTT